jgi:hypothetical protein
MVKEDDDATRIIDTDASATEKINTEFHDGNTQETEVIKVPPSHAVTNINLLQQEYDFAPGDDTIFSSSTVDNINAVNANGTNQPHAHLSAESAFLTAKNKKRQRMLILISIIAALAIIGTVVTIFIVNHNTSMQAFKDELSQETAKYDANYTNFDTAYNDANKILTDIREKDVQNPTLVTDLRTVLLEYKPYKIKKTWVTDGNADNLQNSIAEAKDLNTKLIQSTTDLQSKTKLVLDSKETKSKQANEQALASARLTLRDMLTAGRQTLADSEGVDVSKTLVDALRDAVNKADGLIADEKSVLQALKDAYTALENARNAVLDAIKEASE